MAITITKAPTGIYPAYNDSYIQFTSTLAGHNRAEIEVLPTSIFPNKFVVYPDLNGVYTFNLKDVVRVLMNTDGFKDQDTTLPAAQFGESLLFGYISQAITIRVYNATTNEFTSPTYEFIRGVKQIGEQVYINPAQLLNVSDNGVDYNLTYFEGYPFSFELQRINSGQSIVLNNLNSGDSSIALIASNTGSYRFYIDKGFENFTSSGFLPLSDTINRLEVEVDAVFKTNIRVKKVNERCGVYLKWFNADGGYSYFLFDEFYRYTLDAGSKGTTSTNSFENVGSLVAPTQSLGKEGAEQLRLKATIDKNEEKLLRSLFTSPSVQMYTSQTPYVAGQWVDVEVSSNYSISNKKSLNEITVNVQLPNLITPSL